MSEINAKSASKPFFIWSCILHVSILLALILSISLSGSSAPSSPPSENIIHATVINSQALAQYQKAVEQQQAAQQLAKQQAIQKIQQVLKAEQAAKAEAAAKQVAEIAKAKAVEKAAAEKAEAQKAAALKHSIEKQLKSSMEKQLSKEPVSNTKPSTVKSSTTKTSTTVKSTATSTVANPNPGLMDKYKSMIIQAISEQWVVPQNLPKNISCILSVRVAPGGTVIQVTVEKSSGNPVLDNSAIAAVNKASPLPVPTDANLFDEFRTLKLTVKPDGSLLEE